MANLVPPQGKKRIVWEYRFRVATVWMFLCAAACAAVAALMVPTYLLVSAQHRAVAEEMQADASQERFKDAEKEIERANELAEYLHDEEGDITLTPFIETIDRRAGSEVTVTGYSLGTVEEKKRTSTVLSLAGVAANREVLTAFKDVLAGLEGVEEVDLPLASLAGDVNITFTMQLILHTEQTSD